MDDRTLLELAARAAGIDSLRYDEATQSWRRDRFTVWNPLESDGDAFRLAVKLQLYIGNDGGEAFAIITPTSACHEEHNGDPYAATRRAIVRAAAEIGKGLDAAEAS
jgi:hypothetical protein